MNLARLREFIRSFTRLIEQSGGSETQIFNHGRSLLQALISHDDWLPDRFARAKAESYQQYLLHCDPLERFSVVSFVWGGGQSTPIHDHTVWGMIGVMRGAEFCEAFRESSGQEQLQLWGTRLLPAGSIDMVSPATGDIHRVANHLKDHVSISIHVYGANIGAVKRHVYDQNTGVRRSFVSGYSGSVMPNIWDNA